MTLTTPSAVAEPVVAPVTEVAQGCRPLTDQAMAKDMAAVMAKAKKVEASEQAELFTAAIHLWRKAAQQCEGRAKERALKSMEDDQQLLSQLTEALSASPQCASGQKDAAVMQDMAKQALTERRWSEAASLFHKSENLWDYASERCTGSQQTQAQRRREQSAQDGHNAEHCAPLFEAAREQTQKLRGAAASMTKEEKQEASMVAETLWRDAMANCQGAAVLEIAANNAKALARERGTPWVPRLAPADVAVQTAGVSGQAQLGRRKSRVQTSALSSEPVATGVLQGLTATPLAAASSRVASAKPILDSSATPVGAAVSTAAVLPQAGVIMAGTTRFAGQFARDEGGTTLSGTGKVTWDTGDVFEGTMVKGLRHGKGSITWANGQRYTGDWVLDKPTGQAKVHFANGNDFEGSVVNGVPQGSGRMRYASGDEFVGQFRQGEPDVHGVYTWRNGQRFEGQWVNGRPNGQGKLEFATGNKFAGVVVNGVPQGLGRMLFATGEIYEGQFSAGEPDGEGSFFWPSGDKYVGQWKAGKKHGKGVFTWKSGDLWEGVYNNDEQVR
ncbi:hypothetical protein [Rhodoferax sp.]|uniref:MORN repeat-containing protein n=1 Tax=Rhodoferax sp. TaxID=50421 RepID=UPI00261D4736|nr:hypothetical protein [Rhodoferax sp.]